MKKIIYTYSMILLYLFVMTSESYACDQDPISEFIIYRDSNCINVGETLRFVSDAYDPDDGTTPNIGITSWMWVIDGDYISEVNEPYLDYTFEDSELHIHTVQLIVRDDDIHDPGDYYFPSEILEVYVSEVDLPFWWSDGYNWMGTMEFVYVPVAQSAFIRANGKPNSGSSPYRTYFPYCSPTWSISPSGPAISEYSSGYCDGGSYSDMVLVYNFPEVGTYTLTAKAGEDDPGKDVDIMAFDVSIINPNGNPQTSEGANETNERYFDSSSTGILTVECVAYPNPTSTGLLNYLNDNKVRWTITPISGSTLTWNNSWPGDNTKGEGLSCTATFTGLPSSNDSFGLKEVKMEVLTDGVSVDITKTTNIEVFYSKTATNHPSDASNSNWPNWMYYWMQTVTPLGDPTPTFGYGTVNAYIWEWNEISLADNSATYYDAPYGTHNTLTGIDLFAWRVRHESQHYVDATAFWDHDVENWISHWELSSEDDDYDKDYIPNGIEINDLYETYGYDWTDDNTHETPGVADDNEDWDCQRNKDVVGDHSKDWGKPGFNHRDNDNYNN